MYDDAVDDTTQRADGERVRDGLALDQATGCGLIQSQPTQTHCYLSERGSSEFVWGSQE